MAQPCGQPCLVDPAYREERGSAISFFGTVDTEQSTWIKGQAFLCNRFTTIGTIPISTLIKAFQGCVNPQKFLLPPPLGFPGHGLVLQGIHAGKTANPGLIELDRLAILSMAVD